MTSQPTDKLIREALSLGECLSSSSHSTSVENELRQVTWNEQNFDGVVLHVYGSSMENPGAAGFGAVLRNSDGTWIKGACGYIGRAGNIKAELVALLKGLQLARDGDHNIIGGYSDSMECLRLVQDADVSGHSLEPLILNIRDLISSFGHCNLVHIIREGNTVADFVTPPNFHTNQSSAIRDITAVTQTTNHLCHKAKKYIKVNIYKT